MKMTSKININDDSLAYEYNFSTSKLSSYTCLHVQRSLLVFIKYLPCVGITFLAFPVSIGFYSKS